MIISFYTYTQISDWKILIFQERLSISFQWSIGYNPNTAEKVMISKIPNSLQLHASYIFFVLINKQNNFYIELFANMLQLQVPSVLLINKENSFYVELFTNMLLFFSDL